MQMCFLMIQIPKDDSHNVRQDVTHYTVCWSTSFAVILINYTIDYNLSSTITCKMSSNRSSTTRLASLAKFPPIMASWSSSALDLGKNVTKRCNDRLKKVALHSWHRYHAACTHLSCLSLVCRHWVRSFLQRRFSLWPNVRSLALERDCHRKGDSMKSEMIIRHVTIHHESIRESIRDSNRYCNLTNRFHLNRRGCCYYSGCLVSLNS